MKNVILLLLGLSILSSAYSQNVELGPSLKAAWTGIDDYEHELTILLDVGFDFETFRQDHGAITRDQSHLVSILVEQLKEHTEADQRDLISWLTTNGVDAKTIKSYWIENALFVRASERLIEKLKGRTDIAEIHLNGDVELFQSENALAATQKGIREIGLEAIKAPFMWNRGYTGYGTKIFIIDSGVDPFHPALQRQNAWNNYPIQDVWIGTNDEGFTYDCEEHGTHVIGIACGLDRDEEDTIGVAFNAEWLAGNAIGCTNRVPRNNILDMFQWALNPDGNSSTTEDIPDVINNSWGDFSLGYCSAFYRNSLAALENANIAAIFSAGNLGPMDRTLSPPGNLQLSEVNPFTVGAVNSREVIADFSSRGPSVCNVSGSFPIKPEVCAPGVSVRSSITGGSYSSFDGTSMASPHVAGAFALLKEAFPNATSRVIKEALFYSAVDLGPAGEDNAYGNGIINLERAYNYMTSRGNTPSDPSFQLDLELWDVAYNEEGCRKDYGAQVQIYNGGKRAITRAQIEMRIQGTPFLSVTQWEGTLVPGQKTWVSLDRIDPAVAGNFTLLFRIIDVNNGGQDDRTLNDQLKRRVLIKDGDDYEVSVQDDFGDLCVGSRVAISVSETYADAYNWYDDIQLNEVKGEGKTFTPELSNGSNTFYVLPKYKNKFVGPAIPAEEELSFGFRAGVLEFEVSEPIILRSFDLRSKSNGALAVRFVREEIDTVYRINNFPVFARAQTIPINASLPVGTYKVEIINAPELAYSANVGTNFPHVIDDVISITGGSPQLSGRDPYYYFFNWKVEYDHPCGYKEIIVETNGSGSVPEADFDISTTTLDLTVEDQIQLDNRSTGANSYLWMFGDGTTSGEFSPSHQYALSGRYGVSLIAKSEDGCTDATSVNLLVTGMTSSTDERADFEWVAYPNPTSDQFYLKGASTIDFKDTKISVFNSLGQKMNVQKHLKSANVLELDLVTLKKGIYMVHVEIGNSRSAFKLVKLN